MARARGIRPLPDRSASSSARAEAGLLEVVGQLLVIPRRGRVGGQEEDVRQVVRPPELERLEVEHRGDQDDAVERDPLVGEVARQARRAGRAVALADEVKRRGPASVAASGTSG